MARGEYLGEFEHLVLLGVMRLGDQAYGVAIRQEIAKRAGRDVSIGAIYATLDRLEAKGYIRSEFGPPTAERGGRAKRFFRITANGMAVVNATLTVLRRMTEGLTLSRKLT